jgi:hypothetical protein
MAEPPSPRIPAPFGALAGRVFQALSAARGKRIFHPVGDGYAGTMRVEVGAAAYPGTPLLAEPAVHPAVVRCSRAVGLPESLPDVLGLAVRLPELHGPGLHQDFLLVSSGEGPVLQNLLLPATSFFAQPFSSLLPYRVDTSLRLVGAVPVRPPAPADAGPLGQLGEAVSDHQARFHLALASLGGRWRQFGTLSLLERLEEDATEALCMNPWNTGGGIRPTGPLMGIRDPAYRGSQRGRGADPEAEPAAVTGGGLSEATTSTASPSS